jgi:hypothetical protein
MMSDGPVPVIQWAQGVRVCFISTPNHHHSIPTVVKGLPAAAPEGTHYVVGRDGQPDYHSVYTRCPGCTVVDPLVSTVIEVTINRMLELRPTRWLPDPCAVCEPP